MELAYSAPQTAPPPLASNRLATESSISRALWLKPFGIFILAFLLYSLSRSPALDEIDSVNFAMGVQHYNLWEHQPHPPGYPLYVFFGWIGHLLGASPEVSLHFVSALGGAMFVAIWFGIVRIQFNERLAWWVSGCLVITPAVWMTATKVLSDCPAAAFLSAQILAAICYSRGGRRNALFATSLLGAAAMGVRPQLFLVVFTVLITALWQRSDKTWRKSVLAWAMLIGASLCWLIPVWWIQARLHPDVAVGSVYPKLVYKFWAGRLHKPDMYLFAGDWSPKYLATKCVFHFLGWFGVGFGFIQSWLALVGGALVSLLGVGAYVFRPKEPQDAAFWKFHTGWAVVHIAGIFVSVTASQRYYVVIFPLLLVALFRGLLRLAPQWNKLAFAVPAVLLLSAIPSAIANHRDDPPPLRFIQYLKQLYPSEQRNRVVLVLSTRTKRHAEWYGKGFTVVSPVPPAAELPALTKDAIAVYTDDGFAPLPTGWYRVPLNAFGRSVMIYWKVHYLELYLVDRHNVQ